jgi:hypothetical protein
MRRPEMLGPFDMIFLADTDRTGILRHEKETGTEASVRLPVRLRRGRYHVVWGVDLTWISKIKIEYGKEVPGGCHAGML